MGGDKRAAFETVLKKLEKLIAHLGNDNDSEALVALRKINGLLRSKNLDWHDLIALMSEQKESLWDLLERLVEKDADALVRLGRQNAEFFHTTNGGVFADVMVDGCRNTWPLTSADFLDWLRYKFYHDRRKAPADSAVQAAVHTLGAHARFEGHPREVYLRTAAVGRKIYIDVADPERHVIEVDHSGWRVLSGDAPVCFRRTDGMAALPLPQPGGSIEQLRSFVNLSAEDFILLVAVMADALRPNVPHPVVNIVAEDGSAKTTLLNILHSFVDPSVLPASALPTERRDLFAQVNNALVLAFDNVSAIPPKISDLLCMIASGMGDAQRRLYSNAGLELIGGKRSVFMTGRTNAITRSDLADRALILAPPKMEKDKRRAEGDFWPAFEAERAKIFGALLDVVAHGLKRLPHMRVSRPPRMTDFVLFGCACETAFTKPGAFLAALAARTEEAVEDVIDANPVAKAVAAFMHTRKIWHCTCTQLYKEITVRDPAESTPSASRGWPKDSTHFSAALRAQSAVLRKVGIERSISTSARPIGGGIGC